MPKRQELESLNCHRISIYYIFKENIKKITIFVEMSNMSASLTWQEQNSASLWDLHGRFKKYGDVNMGVEKGCILQ